jgi:Ca2+/H+ antiporter, TMEM165/GDT1 family
MSVVLFTVLSSFIASAVEFVEALTVVLAVGVTRQWRSTLLGVGAAIIVLIALIAILGLTIATFVPIELLRLVVGAVLIVFGLQWLTKAVVRAAGARASRDEVANFGRELAALAKEPPVAASGMDWISFTVAFKGVLLEGLEVAFIVVTFGAAGGHLVPALIGAGLAGIGVLGVGAAVRRPLSRLPENQLKFGVGLMLVSFGTFWAGEGIGVAWPGSDLSIVLLLAGYLVVSLLAVRTVAVGLVIPEQPAAMQALEETN